MLGNVLRAKEDALVLRGEDLEGYVIRHYGKLSPMLQDEHHVHRTRMVLFCWLTLVFGLLAVLNPLLLAGIAPLWMTAASVAAHLGMAWISYGAAISSAQGYGVALQEINSLVSGARPGPSLPARDGLHRHAMLRTAWHRAAHADRSLGAICDRAAVLEAVPRLSAGYAKGVHEPIIHGPKGLSTGRADGSPAIPASIGVRSSIVRQRVGRAACVFDRAQLLRSFLGQG